MGSGRPPEVAARPSSLGELDNEEVEWVCLFRDLNGEERDALFQIVRTMTGRLPSTRIHMPASVIAAMRATDQADPLLA